MSGASAAWPFLRWASRIDPDKRERTEEFIRFLIVGLLNTLFGYGVFVVVVALGAGIGLALVVSTILGVLFNFQTTRRLVFRSKAAGLLGRFVAVYGVSLAINYLALRALAQTGLPAWIAQGILILPLALLTFVLQRQFVFGRD